MSLPAAPTRGFSFTAVSTNTPAAQQPGTNLDAEFDRTNNALGALINSVSVSINADGTLSSAAVQAAYNAAAGGGGGGTNIADAPSQLYMQLAQDWAEYLPGALPADSLAQTGVTGSHFSARYWAIQAAANASSVGQPGQGLGLSLKDNYGAAGDGVTDDTAAVNNFLGAVIGTGGIGFVPAGTYRCTSPIVQDWAAARTTGARFYGAGSNRSVFDLRSLTTANPPWQMTCSAGNKAAFYGAMEGIGFLGNTPNPVVRIGLSDNSDAFNTFAFRIQATNASTSASACGIAFQGVYNSELFVVGNCAGHGDALRFVQTQFCDIFGSGGNADTGIHLTSGFVFGNVFHAMDLEVVNLCVSIDSASATRNTFIGGQYVWSNGSGPAVAAISATAGSNNRFINPNFGSGGTVVGSPTGILIDGMGYGTVLGATVQAAPASGDAVVIADAVAGQSRYLMLRRAGLNRWQVSANNATESGSNVGTNFLITRYNDAGTSVDNPISIDRSTGAVSLSATPTSAQHATTKTYVDTAAALAPLRNRLYNAWHEVQQRGTSFAAAGYTSDRWQAGSTGTPTTTIASGSVGPCRFYLSTSAAVALSGTVFQSQRLEAADCFDLVGQTVTVSFYAATTNSGGATTAQIQLYYANAANNFGAVTPIGSTTVSVIAAFARVSATFAALPAQAANGLLAQLIVTASAAGTVVLSTSGAQLEIGSTPTALEKRPYSLENALCQRFYQTVTVSERFPAAAAAQIGDTAVNYLQMRAAPTSALATAGSSSLATSSTFTVTNNNSGRFEVVASGAGDCYVLVATYSLTAEL